MMKIIKQLLIIFAALLLIACVVGNSLCFNENQNLSKEQAVEVATNYMENHYDQSEYIKESLEVLEKESSGNYWNIIFKRAKAVRPPNIYLTVDKVSGNVTLIQMK